MQIQSLNPWLLATSLTALTASAPLFATDAEPYAVAETVTATGQTPMHSIESCARLLPKGQKFELSISGTVDTGNAEKPFTGIFSLSDGSTREDASPEASQFIECVKKVIG